MGYREETRAKLKSGAYRPKEESALASGFTKAADIIASSWIKEAQEEKEAEKIRLKEEKAERKRIRAAQQKAEAKEKKLKDNAIYLARTYTNDPTNVSAVQFFHEQLKLMDGDVGDVMSYSDKLIENGRLNFTPSSTETETLEFQGPNVPANAKLEDFGGTVGSNKFENGTDATLGDLPKISINDKNSSSLRAQASEMNDMFGHLAEGTTLPEPGEVDVTVPGGIEFTAAKRKYEKIDISKLKTYEDWSATNTDISANSRNVDPEFMKFFNERGQNLKDLEKTEKVENLFSMEVLLGDDMTASKLQDRIDLAKAKSMEVPEYIASDVLPILQDRGEYTQKELITMTPEKRALVAKYSTDPKSREAAARINAGDVAAYSWISEASGSAEAMTAKSKEFFQAGDLVNFNLATTMAKSIRNGEASYKDLLEPTYLVGKSAQELNAIRRIAEQANAPASELTALTGEIAAAEALEKSGLYRKYADNATSVNTTETQISLAKKEGAGNNIIQALEDLKAQQQANSERQTAAEKNGFNIVTVEAKVPLGDGKFEYKTVYQKPGETGYRDAEGTVVTNALPLGTNENDAFKTIRTETQKIITELGVANTALAEGMNTATQAIEIVEDDARVAGAGGKLAKFLTSAGRSGGQVLSVVEELFETNDEITLDQLQRQGGFDNKFLDAVLSGNVQNLADATARFEAKMLSLAFQVGRMEGQSGNAMSNQDFRKIMEIVRTSGGSAEAFKKNLTDYMAGKIESYDQKHFKVVGPGSQIQGFKDNYGFSPVSEPLNMADYVAAQSSQTLKDNYKRFTGASIEPPRGSGANSPVPGLSAVQFGKLQNYFTGGISDKVLRDTLTQLRISDVDAALEAIKKAGSE